MSLSSFALLKENHIFVIICLSNLVSMACGYSLSKKCIQNNLVRERVKRKKMSLVMKQRKFLFVCSSFYEKNDVGRLKLW